jgi:hypothetical protein
VQLVELQNVAHQIRERGWGLAAITIDAPPVLARFVSERGLTYPLFGGKQAIAAAGLTDPRFAEDPARAGAPHPVIYLLDAKGRITARFFEEERVSLASVLARLGIETKGGAPQAHSSPSADVRIWLPDGQVNPGATVSIAFDITPKPGMHLYAPGDHSYTPVTVSIDPGDGITPQAVSLPLSLPPGTPYTFTPLNETVNVFARAFTAFQDIRVMPDAAGPDLSVRGRLQYQACDDAVCYPAHRVPFEVSWRVNRQDRYGFSLLDPFR